MADITSAGFDKPEPPIPHGISDKMLGMLCDYYGEHFFPEYIPPAERDQLATSLGTQFHQLVDTMLRDGGHLGPNETLRPSRIWSATPEIMQKIIQSADAYWTWSHAKQPIDSTRALPDDLQHKIDTMADALGFHSPIRPVEQAENLTNSLPHFIHHKLTHLRAKIVDKNNTQPPETFAISPKDTESLFQAMVSEAMQLTGHARPPHDNVQWQAVYNDPLALKSAMDVFYIVLPFHVMHRRSPEDIEDLRDKLSLRENDITNVARRLIPQPEIAVASIERSAITPPAHHRS